MIPLVCLHNQALWRVTAQRAQWQLPAQCLIPSSSWAVELYLCATAPASHRVLKAEVWNLPPHLHSAPVRTTPWCLHSLWDPGTCRGCGDLPHLCALARNSCCPSCHQMHTQVLYLPEQSVSLEDAPASAWDALNNSQQLLSCAGIKQYSVQRCLTVPHVDLKAQVQHCCIRKFLKSLKNLLQATLKPFCPSSLKIFGQKCT